MGDLSEHFSRSEFRCTGCTPENPCHRTNIDSVHAALLPLLEKIRNHYEKPVRINSAYRCPERNKVVGGASNSRHLYGQAADIVVLGVDPREVAKWIDTWHEGGLGDYRSFTHIDVRPKRSRWRA